MKQCFGGVLSVIFLDIHHPDGPSERPAVDFWKGTGKGQWDRCSTLSQNVSFHLCHHCLKWGMVKVYIIEKHNLHNGLNKELVIIHILWYQRCSGGLVVKQGVNIWGNPHNHYTINMMLCSITLLCKRARGPGGQIPASAQLMANAQGSD